jgi:hypothetical protein
LILLNLIYISVVVIIKLITIAISGYCPHCLVSDLSLTY